MLTQPGPRLRPQTLHARRRAGREREEPRRKCARDICAGNATRPGNVQCDGVDACVRAAAAAGCTGDDALVSLGRERGLPPATRSLLDDVYQAKLGVFGGPPT